MTFITLELAKSHLRADGDDEDALITLLTSAAEQFAVAYLNRQVYETQDALDAAVTALTAGLHPVVANDAIKAAMLLLLGHLYMNREAVVVGVTTAQLPMGPTYLLNPYRIIPGV